MYVVCKKCASGYHCQPDCVTYFPEKFKAIAENQQRNAAPNLVSPAVTPVKTRSAEQSSPRTPSGAGTRASRMVL